MNNFTPVLLVTLAIGVFYVYIDPTYRDVRVLQAQEAEYAAAVSSAKEVEQIRDGLVAKYNSFATEDLARLEEMVPKKIDNVRLVTEIDALGEQYGISVRSIQLVEEKQIQEEGSIVDGGSDQYRILRISFVFEAGYDSFVKFMGDLERNLRIVDLSTLSFSAVSDVGGTYTYNVTIKTYWLP